MRIAVAHDRIEIADVLLRAGADPNVSFLGIPPLVTAAQWGDVRLVRLLLRYGADPRARDRRGKTAREEADDPQVIRLLP